MSLKKAATAATTAIIATLVMVACAAAQLGPGGASGTRCVTTTTEGRSSLGTVGLLSRQFALPWQGTFGSFVAAQFANSYLARTSSVPVVVRRTAAKR